MTLQYFMETIPQQIHAVIKAKDGPMKHKAVAFLVLIFLYYLFLLNNQKRVGL